MLIYLQTLRTIDEFERDVLHMFQNALMYNNDYHEIYEMAMDMLQEVDRLVANFRAAAQGNPVSEAEDQPSTKRGRKSGSADAVPAEVATPSAAVGTRKRRRL